MQAKAESAQEIPTGNKTKNVSEAEGRNKIALQLTIAICIFFAIFIGVLALLLHFSPGLEWDRYIYLLTGVETITFTAIGWLFGREISRGEIHQAEKRVVDTQQQGDQRVIDAKQDAEQRSTVSERLAEQRVKDAQQLADRNTTVTQEQAKLWIADVNQRTERLFQHAEELANQRIKSLELELATTRGQLDKKRELADVSSRDLYSIAQDIIYLHEALNPQRNFSIDYIRSEIDRIFTKLRHIPELSKTLL